MPEFEPSYLSAMPETGRVLICHRDNKRGAYRVAREELVDIYVSDLAPAGTVYVMNVDQAATPFPMGDYPVFR